METKDKMDKGERPGLLILPVCLQGRAQDFLLKGEKMSRPLGSKGEIRSKRGETLKKILFKGYEK